MKKLLICFLFFIAHSSLCHAQDTVVLKDGKKMNVKVISVTNEVIYSVPPGDKPMSINNSKVSYIKYGDGSVYMVSKSDYTARVNMKIGANSRPYILVSGGVALPIFNGYGGSESLYNDDGESETSGYANNGSIVSVTAGIPFLSKWEITGMFSNIRNEFDATGVMNETNNYSIHHMGNIYANGNYYYNNYSWLLGFTKNSEGRNASLGFSLMMGELVTTASAMHATALCYYFNYPTQAVVNSYFNMNPETQKDFVVEMGMHIDVKLIQHVFLRVMVEFQFSGVAENGAYDVVDMTNGNTLYSGDTIPPISPYRFLMPH